MDAAYTLFVIVVCLLIAVGGALLLIGYLYILPASFARGLPWGITTALPFIVTALYMGLRALLPEGSNQMAFFVLLASALGPIAFCVWHWKEQKKAGIQMLIGLVLMVLAMAVVFGGPGSKFADHLVVKAKEQQKEYNERPGAQQGVPQPPPDAVAPQNMPQQAPAGASGQAEQ